MRLFIAHYTYGVHIQFIQILILRTLDLLTESASNLWCVISLLFSSVEWYAHAVVSDAAYAERQNQQDCVRYWIHQMDIVILNVLIDTAQTHVVICR